MSIPSHPTDSGSAIDLAVRALKCFGGDLTREQAFQLVSLWRYFDDLSAAERTEVVYRFPPGVSIRDPGNSGPGW